MTPADVCMFVRPFVDTIRHFRPLRLSTERNSYIVIVHLRTAEHAASFANVLQGKPFLRGLIPETCCVREVSAILFDHLNDAAVFPSSRMFPPEGAELPACPVCLDPMDDTVSALVTTFCNHTMHAACLAQWDLNRCPVCRHTHELTPEASTCMNCDHRSDLWMCVVCAYVGCGVYKNKHAHDHFAETQHPFATNLQDNVFWTGERVKAGSVWDYVSERFVNRLLTSDDGKIVEVTMGEGRSDGAGSSSVGGGTAVCCGAGERAGAVTVSEDDEENDRSLQAAVYASRMDAVVDEYRMRMERMDAEHSKERERLQAEVLETKKALQEMGREKKALNLRVLEAEKESKRLKDENGFLKSLNETLLRDKKEWNEQVDQLKTQLGTLQVERDGLDEQLRDLMMHLEAQAKISGAVASDSCRSDVAELVGGDVRVGPSTRQRLAMKTNRRVSGN